MNRGTGTGNGAFGFKDSKGQVYCDYAYQVGYTNCRIGSGPARNNATDLTKEIDAGLVILADNPDPASPGSLSTSMNHKATGINILTHYSTVMWVTSPNKGYANNNIYLRDMDEQDKVAGPGDLSVPLSRYDSVLLGPK